MLVCKNCGHDNPGSAVACESCGAKLSALDFASGVAPSQDDRATSREPSAPSGTAPPARETRPYSGAAQQGNAEGLNNQGWQLLLRGEYEEAVELFSRALKADPTFHHAYRNRADAYRRLGRKDLADADMAAARRLAREDREARPWHQTWWATAICIWIPLVFWYGLYVFFAKLRWKERGAVAGITIGILATIFVVAFAVGVFRGAESFLAETDYERQVVLLMARSRDIADQFGTEFEALFGDPDLSGRSLLGQLRPVIEGYRDDLVDLGRQWDRLEPPSEALELHQKGREYWDFEIAAMDECLAAESEVELTAVFLDMMDEEDRLNKELQRLYEDLLFD